MLSIALKDIAFAAPIGLYPEEQLVFNEIIVNVTVKQHADIDNLPYIDYGTLFDFVKKSVEQPTQLLEAIIQRVHHSILNAYPDIHSLDIQVAKKNPPLGGSIGASIVSWYFENKK